MHRNLNSQFCFQETETLEHIVIVLGEKHPLSASTLDSALLPTEHKRGAYSLSVNSQKLCHAYRWNEKDCLVSFVPYMQFY
jgi:hypothetical protein